MEFHVHRHGSVDSTNERAFAALAAGTARHGDVHVAEEQSAGRGRRGASWHSTRGTGLYLSAILLPGAPPLHPAALTIAAGLAVVGAARELGVPGAHLKWPNDVVVARPPDLERAERAELSTAPARPHPAKLAGILVETRGLDALRPHYVVGIGLNVAQTEFPAELRAQRAVTSLRLEGSRATLDEALACVLAGLEHWLRHVRPPAVELTEAFLDDAELRDREVELELPERSVRGRLVALSLEGGLELALADGSRARYALEHVRQLRRPS